MSDFISPWWQSLLLPKRWDVCGVSVPSLSVWHTFALEQLGNHYMIGGICTREDVAGLLLFARTDYRGGRKLILGKFHRGRQIRKIYRKIKDVEWSELHAACLDYLESCMHTARRWQKKDGGGKTCAVPYQWHIVNRICGGDITKMDAAWNTPYALGRCLYDVQAEASGDDTLMKPEYQKMDDELAAEKEKEQAA